MSQVRKGPAAYVGNPGTPVSEWKEIGYVSEDGLAEGPYLTEAADTPHEIRTGQVQREMTMTFPSDEAHQGMMELLMGMRETPQQALKRRLNARWKLHRDPDADHVGIVQLNGRTIPGTYSNPRQEAEGRYAFDFTPAPRKGDPNYYLRNPS